MQPGALHNVSSPISGFTAIPNPYLIPVLYIQSLLIGAGFGLGYQGIRRKVSAMTNEEFNKVDIADLAMGQFKSIIERKDFETMLNMMHPLTDKLATAFGELISKSPEIFGNFVGAATTNDEGSSIFSPNADYSAAFLGGGVTSSDKELLATLTSAVSAILQGLASVSGGNLNPDVEQYLQFLKTKSGQQYKSGETNVPGPPVKPKQKVTYQEAPEGVKGPTLGRKDQLIQNSMETRFKEYKTNVDFMGRYIRQRPLMKSHKQKQSLEQLINKHRDLANTAATIFNQKLSQAKHIKELHFWHTTKPLSRQ